MLKLVCQVTVAQYLVLSAFKDDTHHLIPITDFTNTISVIIKRHFDYI